MSEYKFWVVKDGQLHLFRNPHEDFEPDSNDMEWGALEGIHFHDDETTTWEEGEEADDEDEYYCKCGDKNNPDDICAHGVADGRCCICDLCQKEEKEEEDCVYSFYLCKHCCSEYDETEVDCKHCGRKMCVFVYQAKNKSEAMSLTY